MSLDLFCLSPELIRRVLSRAIAGGGEFADLYAEYSRLNSLVMEEGILKSAYSIIDKGVGLRVLKGEKTGYAYTERMEEAAFLKIAGVAASIANDGGSEQNISLENHTTPNYSPVKDPVTDVELDQKIKWINLANEYAHASSNHVRKVSINFVDNQTEVVMADSRGRLVTDTRPMMRFSVSVVLEANGEKEMGRAGQGGRMGFSYLTEEKVKSYVDRAINEAETLLAARQAPAGMMPVILGPGDSGILLHEAVGHPLEADFNRKGSSTYAGRIGEMVADAQCTIVDDGTVPNNRGSINVDDELNDSQRTVLIEEGRLASYMYDEMSARFYDCPSSGNGRRESYKYQPLPRMRTTYMLPGKYNHKEIIASTKKGIYCETFKGGQVDISNGNFIFVPSKAYLVEDGKITCPVKNLSLIGNGPESLTNVSMVGDDFLMSAGIWTCTKGQTVPVGVGLPTVKIKSMNVGGRQA